MSPTILIVDDEAGVRDLITDALSMASLTSITASHGMEALSKIRTNDVDLVILDINMPTMDGYEVLQRLREMSNTVPVIVLTARLDREDTKQAFELGADDFVRKPFGIEELILRVQAILRRTTASTNEDGRLKCGALLMDIDQHLVTAGGEIFDLSPTEFRLLQVFMENPQRVLSKEQLLARVWGMDNFADPNVVETYVSYLRKKLGSVISIRTVRGVGYQLNDSPVP